MILEFVADIVLVVCEAVVTALAALLEPLVGLLAELLVAAVEIVISGFFLVLGLLRSSSTAARFKVSPAGRRRTRCLIYGLLAGGAVVAACWWLRPQARAPAPVTHPPPAAKIEKAREVFDRIKGTLSGKGRE